MRTNDGACQWDNAQHTEIKNTLRSLTLPHQHTYSSSRIARSLVSFPLVSPSSYNSADNSSSFSNLITIGTWLDSIHCRLRQLLGYAQFKLAGSCIGIEPVSREKLIIEWSVHFFINLANFLSTYIPNIEDVRSSWDRIYFFTWIGDSPLERAKTFFREPRLLLTSNSFVKNSIMTALSCLVESLTRSHTKYFGGFEEPIFRSKMHSLLLLYI